MNNFISNINNIPFINICIDRPYHLKALLNPDYNNVINLWISPRDARNANQYLIKSKQMFMPHAAAVNVGHIDLLKKKRNKDIVLSCNYQDYNDISSVFINNKCNFNITKVEAIYNFYKNSYKSLEECINEILKINTEEIKEIIYDVGAYIDLNARYDHKIDVIYKLIVAGYYLHCFGGGWHKSDIFFNEHLINYGFKPAVDAHKEFENAKIVINSMIPSFDGSHERIFEAMVRGALCITTPSDYLRQTFIEDKEIVYYDPLNLDTLVEKVRYYLDNEDARSRITKNAYKNAIKNHTWYQRINELIKIYENYILR